MSVNTGRLLFKLEEVKEQIEKFAPLHDIEFNKRIGEDRWTGLVIHGIGGQDNVTKFIRLFFNIDAFNVEHDGDSLHIYFQGMPEWLGQLTYVPSQSKLYIFLDSKYHVFKTDEYLFEIESELKVPADTVEWALRVLADVEKYMYNRGMEAVDVGWDVIKNNHNLEVQTTSAGNLVIVKKVPGFGEMACTPLMDELYQYAKHKLKDIREQFRYASLVHHYWDGFFRRWEEVQEEIKAFVSHSK